MTDRSDSLQHELVELSEHLDWPTGIDLAPTVLERIRARPVRRARRWLAPVLVAVAIAVLLLTPPGKEAVAWLLRVAGIGIEFGEVTTPVTAPATLTVGDAVTLTEAQDAVDFPVLVPSTLPAPDSVQLASWGGGRQVVLAWAASDRLPDVLDTGTGLLFFQFRASVDEQLLTKYATESTRVEVVEVRGSRGYFLSDAPHIVMFEDPDRTIFEDSVRLAANVLIWEEDGITYRIESSLGLADTVAVAQSLAPID